MADPPVTDPAAQQSLALLQEIEPKVVIPEGVV
jgi:hypothetical protein